MSSLYELEPPTNGKVLLKTTVGDIEIALWSKEAPKACRNFLQHCANNYYNGTIFHHIQKDFMVQGGDPTGTGQGGQSIYGEPFKDEFHQRLRFTRRGLVAMANCGRPHTNYSQFFITLAPCNDLNNKNTIFGHIVGNTMYNVLKMLDIEVDFSNRPIDPPKIIKANILEQPFSDIVSAVDDSKIVDDAKTKKESIFKHVRASKNRQLLSFGDEEDFQEEVLDSKIFGKPKSIHDVITDDPTLSQKTLEEADESPLNQERQLLDSRKRKIDQPSKTIVEKVDDDDESATKQERTQKKLEKIKEEQRQLKREMKKNMLSVIKKKKQVEKLKSEMKSNEAGGRDNDDDSLYGYDVDSYGTFDVGSVDDYLKVNLKYMVKSQRCKLETKSVRSNREDMALKMLKEFSDKINDGTVISDQINLGNTQDFVSESWLNHKLEFEKDYSVSNAIDTHVVSIDNYDISDPRNRLNQHKHPGKQDN